MKKYGFCKQDLFPKDNMNPQLSPALKMKLGNCMDLIDEHWDRILRSEPGTLATAYDACLNAVVFNDAGVDYTVSEFLLRTVPRWRLSELDSYRMYPPTYVAVNDPDNPLYIRERFLDDRVGFGQLEGRRLNGRLENYYMYYSDVLDQKLKDCDLAGDVKSYVITICNQEIVQGPFRSVHGVYWINVDRQATLMPGKYNMVQCEGHFTVHRNGRRGCVRWVTGDGRIVERPLLRLRGECNRVDMGWYSYVSCCMPLRKAQV